MPARAARSSGKPPATEPAAPARFAARLAASRCALPVLLFAVCFGAYVSNGDFLPGGDQEGNMLFSVNLLKRGSLSLGPLGRAARLLLDPGAAPGWRRARWRSTTGTAPPTRPTGRGN